MAVEFKRAVRNFEPIALVAKPFIAESAILLPGEYEYGHFAMKR